MEATKLNDCEEEKKLFPIFTKRYKPEEQTSFVQNFNVTGKSPKRRRLLGKKETPGFSQMILDAGQKQIGPRFCDDCGMLYSPGEPEDEELHRKAHVKLKNIHSVSMWKDPRILQNYADGGIIVMIQSTDPKKTFNRLRDFLGWVESELSASGESSDSLISSQKLFLYICPTKRKNIVKILGFAKIEILDNSKVVCLPLNPQQSTEEPSILVGITRLWTDASFRKRQIATRLCDIIRFNSGVLGYVAPKHKIAILEPSEDGRAFMNRYSDGKGFYYSYK